MNMKRFWTGALQMAIGGLLGGIVTFAVQSWRDATVRTEDAVQAATIRKQDKEDERLREWRQQLADAEKQDRLERERREDQQREQAERERQEWLAKPRVECIASRWQDGAAVVTLANRSQSKAANVTHVGFRTNDVDSLRRLERAFPRPRGWGTSNNVDIAEFRTGRWIENTFQFVAEVGLHIPPGGTTDLRLPIVCDELAGQVFVGTVGIVYDADGGRVPLNLYPCRLLARAE
jgi:hypothetical protein